jgi:hypothetical protein
MFMKSQLHKIEIGLWGSKDVAHLLTPCQGSKVQELVSLSSPAEILLFLDKYYGFSWPIGLNTLIASFKKADELNQTIGIAFFDCFVCSQDLQVYGFGPPPRHFKYRLTSDEPTIGLEPNLLLYANGQFSITKI